jgi:hypothetical protein
MCPSKESEFETPVLDYTLKYILDYEIGPVVFNLQTDKKI